MLPRQHPRVWFITGISRGFGRELALAALTEGDFVIGTARNGQSELSSPKLSVFRLDVSRAEDVSSVIEKPGLYTVASILL
jgi:NAD(P)-dependent dehydrogenase (short-subunit alcohol dehydrogenase family)